MNSHAPSDTVPPPRGPERPPETRSANLSLPENPPLSYSLLAIHSLAPHTRVRACSNRPSFVMSFPEGIGICHLDDPKVLSQLRTGRFGRGTANHVGDVAETYEPRGLMVALMGVPGELCWFPEQGLLDAERVSSPIPCIRKQFPILPGTHRFNRDGSLLYAPGQHTGYASVQRIFLEPEAALPLQNEYTWTFRTEGRAVASAFSDQGDFLALAIPEWSQGATPLPSFAIKIFALDPQVHAPTPIAVLPNLPSLSALYWEPCGKRIYAASSQGEFFEAEFKEGDLSLSRSLALPSPIGIFTSGSDAQKLLAGTNDGIIWEIDLASLDRIPLASVPGAVTSLASLSSNSTLAVMLSTGALHVLQRAADTSST